jgi:hypothetical protein
MEAKAQAQAQVQFQVATARTFTGHGSTPALVLRFPVASSNVTQSTSYSVAVNPGDALSVQVFKRRRNFSDFSAPN